MNIPLSDLGAQHEALKNEINTAIQNVVKDSAFIGTPGNKYVQQFEDEFSAYTNIVNCIACANGSDAIELALRALDVGFGDEVIVPARTWIATASAVSMVGANPVFVDTQEGTHNIDPIKIESVITEKTKAIIVVHLYGCPADMDEVLNLAKKYDLRVIEDCAQAHGAFYKGKHVGCFGNAATFSFFPGKNLGAMGDAGAVMTGDEVLAKRIRRFINHGRLAKDDHAFEGRNSRMDGLQAAILSVKLKYLDVWIYQRRNIAQIYKDLLKEADLMLPVSSKHDVHGYHQFVIQLSNRDLVREEMKLSGVATGVHYPEALPFIEAYKHKQYVPEHFPVAFKQSQQILSLPIYPEMPFDFVDYVANKLIKLLVPINV